MRIASINTTADGRAAPGRIMMDISRRVAREGSALAIYGRGADPSPAGVELMRFGTRAGVLGHALLSRVSDAEGLASRSATSAMAENLRLWRPDVLHLHNLHGHYLHLPMLLDALADMRCPVVVTLHDYWLLTGHCPYFTHIGCDRAHSGCKGRCPARSQYPRSLTSHAARNYEIKMTHLGMLPDVTFVAVSAHMAAECRTLIPSHGRLVTISNGVDTDTFAPRDVEREDVVLAVANRWDERKNLAHLLALAPHLRPGERIVVAGAGADAARKVGGVEVVKPIDADTLASLYSRAKVTVNASSAETFGMVTAESMACGTPVVVNRAGALPSLIAGAEGVGVVTDTSDVAALRRAIDEAAGYKASACRRHALDNFSAGRMAAQYLELYSSLVSKQ